jgi:hypothetical protein
MTEKKSGEFSLPKRAPSDRQASPSRPDAEQAKEGAPPHEEAKGPSQKRATQQNDKAHGHSQDSGYGSSGGYGGKGGDERRDRIAEFRTAGTGNGHTHTDYEIRSEIQTRLSRERAPRASRLLVSVGQGIVTLSGEVDDEFERKRLTDIVRDVGAVRELRDELSTRTTRNDIN